MFACVLVLDCEQIRSDQEWLSRGVGLSVGIRFQSFQNRKTRIGVIVAVGALAVSLLSASEVLSRIFVTLERSCVRVRIWHDRLIHNVSLSSAISG